MLDVGAGIGALSFELLAAGAERVTAVDAAPAYLAAVREEAGRRNVSDRLNLVLGDFVSVAGEVMPADVVTIDRVVCCYPARLRADAASRDAEMVGGSVRSRLSCRRPTCTDT